MRLYELIFETRRPLPVELVNSVKQMYDDGKSSQETGDALGIPAAKVRDILFNHYKDRKFRLRPTPLPVDIDTLIVQIKNLYDTGKNAEDIATQLGIPKAKVSALLHQRLQDRTKRRTPPTEKEIADIKRLYDQTSTAKEMAEILNMPLKRVNYILNRYYTDRKLRLPRKSKNIDK